MLKSKSAIDYNNCSIPTIHFYFALLLLSSFSLSKSYAMVVTEENSDRLNRWKSRWDNNKLGWHEKDVHESLIEFGDKFIPNFKHMDDESSCAATDEKDSNDVRVFVPLCGKTVDMAYLSKNSKISQIVGIDGIRKALEEFANENPDLEINTAATTSNNNNIVKNENGKTSYEVLKGNKIVLLKGDFFELDDTVTNGRFDSIFDRASMVAIDPTMREKYVSTLGRLLKPGGKILLVAIERRSGTDEDKNGPPFSLTESNIRDAYKTQDWVDSITVLKEHGEQKRNKDTTMISMFYLIQSKQ